MKVTVRLFAMLRSKLPPDSNGEEMELELEEGATPQTVIEQLQIPPELANLVMVDGTHLLKEEIRSRTLQAGDVVSIFPPVAGG